MGSTGSEYPQRRIVGEIFYAVRTGCARSQLPKDLAPWPTVYWYVTRWHDAGTVERIMELSVAESVRPRAAVLNRPPG
ncbi:transposase [Streptomyces sp. enrichment culture]|uniref:transposase n=1 Tax=Streptomyces sp. enrichment culture TaxID=1795815 RepID=UPI003F55451F